MELVVGKTMASPKQRKAKHQRQRPEFAQTQLHPSTVAVEDNCPHHEQVHVPIQQHK